VVQVWEVATARCLQRLSHHADGRDPRRDHPKSVASIQFFPSGRYFVTGGWDQSLRIFELDSGTPVAGAQCDVYCTNAIAVAPDGKSIASAGGAVTLRDLVTNVKDGEYYIHIWKLAENLTAGE
jgi:WD40 repeat protein